MVTPLLILRYSQEQYISRTKDNVHELRKKNRALEKSLEENNLHNEELLFVLAEVIDLRDPYVLGHSKQVSQYASLIATELGLNRKQIELIRKAGLLHDIGKLGIPEHILFKPARLSGEEYELIKNHSKFGAELLSKSKSLRILVPAVHHHHERYDGLGYPDRLKDGAIPIEARILALADAIEAMASDRPYRTGMSADEILDEIRMYKGTQFDPLVVDAFIRIIHEKGQDVLQNDAREKQPEQLAQIQ